MRLTIGGAVDTWITKISPRQWEQLIHVILNTLTVVEGGEETDFIGSSRLHVRNYLSDVRVCDPLEMQGVLLGKGPAIVDGQITICLAHLQQYLNKNGHGHSAREVASMLTAIEAFNKRPKAGALRDQSRWFLPSVDFAPGDYCEPSER